MKSHEKLAQFLPSPKNYYDWLAGLAVLAFIITFAGLALQRHAAFLSGFDLGVYDQVVWNTLHGRFFFYTSTGQPLLHLSNHADPILALVALFYLLHDGPETLLILQAALIGLAGVPVYLLAKEKLPGNFAALGLLAAFLFFPGIETVTLSDFHPPALAFAFLMFAFYFLENRRNGWFLLFAVLAMACKEQIPLQVMFLGLYAIVRHKDWRLGMTTILLATVWFAVVMLWVIPAFSVTGEHPFLSFYSDFGHSPLEIVKTVITRPDIVLKDVWQPEKLAYLRDLFVPFAFLPLLGLPVLLVGAPSFAINLLSNNPAMHNAMRGHYVADVTPWLVWASLFGLFFLMKLARGRKWTLAMATVILLMVSLGWHWQNGFSPLSAVAPHYPVTAHDRLGQQLVAQIPADASISSQLRLYAHLSNRKIAYVFPFVHEADYIFLDVTADTSPLHPNDLRLQVQQLLDSGDFGVLTAADGYILLKRGALNTALPDAFFDFARVPDPRPEIPLDVQFGDSLRLVGADVLDNPRRAETQVRLYWQALKPIDDSLRLYPFFINPNGDVIEDTTLRPMATQLWYPPSLWKPGETVVSETLPWTLGNEWSLAVGVLRGEDWADWTQRMPVTTSGGARRFEAGTWVRVASFARRGRKLASIAADDSDLQPPNVAQFNFDNKMELRGYAAERTRDTLNVTLFWQASAAMARDYTVFVHLLDANGNVIAQHDGQPTWQLPIPTSTWQPGETLRDSHSITLPADLPPGEYRLRMGVYFWQTLERLPVLDDGGAPVGDSVALGSVRLP